MIKINGKAKHVSREQIRAFLHASIMLLVYHNQTPWQLPLTVSIRKQIRWNGKLMDGLCSEEGVQLRWDLSPEDMLTTCLHEAIHVCMDFPKETIEKNTSTLCNRLKPDVARLAEVLLDGTYKRAGYLAHTKMTYRATNGDHYDNSQYRHIGVITKYKR